MALIVGNTTKGTPVVQYKNGNVKSTKTGTVAINNKGTTNKYGYYGNTKAGTGTTVTDYKVDTKPTTTKDTYVAPTVSDNDSSDYASSAIADYYSQLLADQKALRDNRSATLDSVYNRAKDAYVATNTKNKKALTREYKMLGQNPSQSKLWDMDYNLARYLNDLDIQKNESKADIDSDYYNARNSAMSGILSSGLENSALYNALKKFRGA